MINNSNSVLPNINLPNLGNLNLSLPNSVSSPQQNIKPLTIVFCLAGKTYSNIFLSCWSDLIYHCFKNGYKFHISQAYSPNIYYARNLTLRLDIKKGKDQKPFDGKIDYDYLLFIDSDMVFSPQHLEMLLSHNVDFVSGLYLMDGGLEYAAVEHWNESYFKAHGHFHFLSPEDIKKRNKNKLIEVSYNGFGFVLVKRGVFEKMKYPHFEPLYFKIDNLNDFCMEDASIYIKAQKLGFKTYIDPQVVVGHEKSKVY
jgi:hypothetical protein